MDAIDAILPAGTLSGAPKLRAAEIIDQLEHNKRGGVRRGHRLSGLYRQSGRLHRHPPGLRKKWEGVHPLRGGHCGRLGAEKEYQECINKAKAVVRALELAQKERDL